MVHSILHAVSKLGVDQCLARPTNGECMPRVFTGLNSPSEIALPISRYLADRPLDKLCDVRKVQNLFVFSLRVGLESFKLEVRVCYLMTGRISRPKTDMTKTWAHDSIWSLVGEDDNRFVVNSLTYRVV
jgi:hypothetical protein